MNKFNNFLPDKYKLFINKEEHQLIFYINDKELTTSEVTTSCLAWLVSIWMEEDNEMTISWLITNIDYRGNGLGSLLIIAAATYYKQKYDVKKIELDDCSNHCFLEDNIYTSLGFKYIKSTEPEMIGKTSNIIKKWSSFINKNKRKKFYN